MTTGCPKIGKCNKKDKLMCSMDNLLFCSIDGILLMIVITIIVTLIVISKFAFQTICYELKRKTDDTIILDNLVF